MASQHSEGEAFILFDAWKYVGDFGSHLDSRRPRLMRFDGYRLTVADNTGVVRGTAH